MVKCALVASKCFSIWTGLAHVSAFSELVLAESAYIETCPLIFLAEVWNAGRVWLVLVWLWIMKFRGTQGFLLHRRGLMAHDKFTLLRPLWPL